MKRRSINRTTRLAGCALSLLVGTLLGLTAPATAAKGRLNNLLVSHNATRVGTTIQVTVKASKPACGFQLDLGDGRTVQAGVNRTKTVPVKYEAVGTYTISVAGKRVGNKPACRGTAAPVSVSVAERLTLKRNRLEIGVGELKPKGKPGGEAPDGSSSSSPHRPDAVLHEKPKISRPSCETHPCVQTVSVQPAGDSASFQVTANKIHKAKILVGLSKPIGSKWSSHMPGPKLVANTQAYRNPSLVDFLSLEPDKDYWYLIEVTDEDGRSSFHDGAFSTKSRRVTVTLVKVFANDDGDDTDAGEFSIRVALDGVEKISASTDISTGTSVDLTSANCTPCHFTVNQSPPSLELAIGFAEVDRSFSLESWQHEESISVDAPGSRTILRQVTGDDADATITLRVDVSYE